MFCQEPLAALEEPNNILMATTAASPVLKQVSAVLLVNITPSLPLWIVLSVVQAMNNPFRSAVTTPSEELMEMEAAATALRAAPLVPTMKDHLNVAAAVTATFYQGLTVAKLGSNFRLIMPAAAARMSTLAVSSAPLTLTQAMLNAQPARSIKATSSLGAPAATPTTINTLMAMMDAKLVEKFWWGVWNATFSRGSRPLSVPTVTRLEDF
jgi:hypothetical protein